MKNELPKHEVHTLSDGSLVIYLRSKPTNQLFYDISLNQEEQGRDISCFVMPPKYYNIKLHNIQGILGKYDADDDWFEIYGIPVYRGKLKTRIKQLEEEIKHKEQMKANAALDPMNTVTLDKFDKHSAETEKVYITGGDLEKLKPKMDKIREASRNKHKQGAELWAGENPLTKRDAFISKLSSSPKYQSALINVSFTLGFLLGAAFITAVVLIANLL